jgi:hypothetical protein
MVLYTYRNFISFIILLALLLVPFSFWKLCQSFVALSLIGLRDIAYSYFLSMARPSLPISTELVFF